LRAPGVSPERDHIIPVARGGTNNIENILALCGPCNRRKHAKPWLVFMREEIARSVATGNVYGGEGPHANDIGGAAYGGQGGAHFGAGGAGSFTGAPQGGAWRGPTPRGGAWTALQFALGLARGAIIVPLGFLFGALLLLAIVGEGTSGRRRRGAGRLVEGAVAGFGLWRLWTWAFNNSSHAKTAGMIVGALAAGLYMQQAYRASEAHHQAETPTPVTETVPADPGKYRLTESGPAPQGLGVRPVDLSNGPTAVRPLTVIPPFAPAWAPPPIVDSTPHGRMGPTQASPFPVYAGAQTPGRRNIGCGWRPIGSDADRDCAARDRPRP
jgi:hypothetical protein